MQDQDRANPHWQDIDRIFAEALEQPSELVSDFLDRQCPDPAARREVESLLKFGDSETNLLDASIASLPEVFELPEAIEDLPAADQRVGPYQLEKELGRGGMGVVYLAARDDGHFEQRVALKRLTLPDVSNGGTTVADDIIRRFEKERQILASLDHPSIARLIDGGVTASGSPFFAMEVVDGLPIDDYCDHHQLSIRQRLALFRQVVEAVSHAHAKLILHRDLKPSNILVTPEGRVKLLDFGIATLLEPVDGRATTRRWLTPDIASPEQVRGEPMSTSADIYQLGLLLYLLFTGRLPYAVPTSSPSAAERVICDTPPPAPSRLFSGSAPNQAAFKSAQGQAASWSAETAAAARASHPTSLARLIAGDLDSVVLQCLRKEPSRRYQSAEALANDLDRHASGLPVLAHPDSWFYRLRKFMKRQHRAVVGGLLLVTLAGYHLITVERQSNAMELERNRAVAEAEKAEAIKSFLVDLFENANPVAARGQDLTVRQVLDQGTPRIEAAFRQQPEVRAEMLFTTGDLYRALGLYPQAEALLARAFDDDEGNTQPSPQHLLRLARLQTDQGEQAAAEQLLRRALGTLRNSADADQSSLADVLDALGMVLVQQKRFGDAPEYLEEALALRRDLLGSEHVDIALSLTHLGLLALRVDDYELAEDQLREAFSMRQRLLPPGHPELASARSNLASILRRLDQLDEALVLLRESVADRRTVLGDDHPYTAISLSNLAQTLREAEQFDEAAQTFEQILEIRRRVLEPEHPMIAANLNDLGLVRRDQGDLRAAALHYREALSIYPPDHPWRRTTEFNLAGVLRLNGDHDEAIRALRRVLDGDLDALGPDHTRVALVRWELGLALRDSQNLEAAARELEEGHRIYQSKLTQDHPFRGGIAAQLGNIWLDLGRVGEAEALLRPTHQTLRRRLGKSHSSTARAAMALGRLEISRGNFEAARPWLIEAKRSLSPTDRTETAQLKAAFDALPGQTDS